MTNYKDIHVYRVWATWRVWLSCKSSLLVYLNSYLNFLCYAYCCELASNHWLGLITPHYHGTRYIFIHPYDDEIIYFYIFSIDIDIPKTLLKVLHLMINNSYLQNMCYIVYNEITTKWLKYMKKLNHRYFLYIMAPDIYLFTPH
jgi:hypothetical protein